MSQRKWFGPVRALVAAVMCGVICLAMPVIPASAARSSKAVVLVPATPGEVVYHGKNVVIDASNTSQGYISVKYTGGAGKVKLQMTRSGSDTYQYSLHKGIYETFPFTEGDGTYTVVVYEQVTGNKYAEALSKKITVKLENSLLPFLYPNQYVNFNAGNLAVKKGEELAAGASSDLEVVQRVYDYVIGNVSYDTAKANSALSGGLTGYLPDVDNTLATCKGICFDYTALLATMLRTQNIPTRLEVGYVSSGAYHAWVSVYLQEQGWVNGIIYFDGTSWKLMDPTFASSGNSSESIMQFIGNGTNYTTKYKY